MNKAVKEKSKFAFRSVLECALTLLIFFSSPSSFSQTENVPVTINIESLNQLNQRAYQIFEDPVFLDQSYSVESSVQMLSRLKQRSQSDREFSQNFRNFGRDVRNFLGTGGVLKSPDAADSQTVQLDQPIHPMLIVSTRSIALSTTLVEFNRLSGRTHNRWSEGKRYLIMVAVAAGGAALAGGTGGLGGMLLAEWIGQKEAPVNLENQSQLFTRLLSCVDQSIWTEAPRLESCFNPTDLDRYSRLSNSLSNQDLEQIWAELRMYSAGRELIRALDPQNSIHPLVVLKARYMHRGQVQVWNANDFRDLKNKFTSQAGRVTNSPFRVLNDADLILSGLEQYGEQIDKAAAGQN